MRPKPLLGPKYWLISDSSQAVMKIVRSSGSAARSPVRKMRPILLISFLRRSAGNPAHEKKPSATFAAASRSRRLPEAPLVAAIPLRRRDILTALGVHRFVVRQLARGAGATHFPLATAVLRKPYFWML